MNQLRIGNAAGTCNRPEHFEKLLKSAVAVTYGAADLRR